MNKISNKAKRIQLVECTKMYYNILFMENKHYNTCTLQYNLPFEKTTPTSYHTLLANCRKAPQVTVFAHSAPAALSDKPRKSVLLPQKQIDVISQALQMHYFNNE